MNNVWVQSDGTPIDVEDMTSTHLFFSIRMIYNHSVPASKQILGCKRWDFSSYPIKARRDGLKMLIRELAKRNPRDLKSWMWDQLHFMAQATNTPINQLQETNL